MSDISMLLQQLSGVLPRFQIAEEEPLARHTSFKVGGPAEVMVFPHTKQELSQVLKIAAGLGIRPKILGAGTNVLAPDEGVRGLVICLRDTFMGLTLIKPVSIEAMAGMSLAKTAMFAARNGLSGMECFHGIPGSVGGGIFMNAGAYGGELKDVAVRTEYMYPDGHCEWFEGEKQEFGYRKSVFQRLEGVIVRTQFALHPGSEDEIRARIKEFNDRRRASQPLELPSAGSTFRRPEGHYAGALIQEAGLKGLTVGGARVSEKHAGFIVNADHATAADILNLIRQVQERVYENSGVRLEPEVRLWGQE